LQGAEPVLTITIKEKPYEAGFAICHPGHCHCGLDPQSSFGLALDPGSSPG
jgi:hypothetical protein